MIGDKLYNLGSFKRQYEALLVVSAGDSIPRLQWKVDKNILLEKVDWNNILGIASVLCQSDNNIHQDAALRISQTCLSLDCCSEIQKDAAAYILETLTNNRAISMAVKKQLLSPTYKDSYSFQQKLVSGALKFENTVLINNKELSLNKFQKAVYKAYENNSAISISAPTSAGKSFVLCAILLDELVKGSKNIIYLVPTRALISQVESDLRELIRDNSLTERINLSTVPPASDEIDQTLSNVFVFTQERLHWFLANNSTSVIKVDLLIIDEAHKIEDGYRGVLLQQKLEELVESNDELKVYFSSPFTSNPEILLDNVRHNIPKEKVNTHFTAVNQNLIYINQVPRQIQNWQVRLVTVDKSYDLGYISLDDRPNNECKKIALIAKKLGLNDSSNIIYSNGAAEAEDIALLVYDSLEESQIGSELYELIKLVKHTIHKDYALARTLEKGIAFHYGNMPLLIRQEIERLFSAGVIRYLICTSTLLEGVNLPAKSIIIRNPKRGKGNPLTPNDFWNLAGRAGRWGKEFSGNIICIEPDKWDVVPNPNKSKQVIKRAIDTIELRGDELISYISDDTPRREVNKKQDLESAFGYYYIKHTIDKRPPADNEFYSRLIPLINEKRASISVPDYIIKRNPGISPIAQQQLLNYFNTREKAIEDYIPVYPTDANAYNEYASLVGRIGKTLSEYPQILNYSRAILLTYWMTGKPLSFIIRKSFESYQSNPDPAKRKRLPAVIREVMDNVETFVRFQFAKDSSCYIDILRYYLELQGRGDLIQNIPQLNLWLEFGVSEKTHLSLLALGLSRNSVIELSGKYITNTQMSKEECVNWIRQQNLEMLDLSPIIIDDIRKTL